MKVKDVMHKGATCVELSTPAKEIARRMRDDNIGAVPVSANGRVAGIITDRDITCRAVAGGGNISKMTAKDLMTKALTCCSPDDDISVAIEAMEAQQVRRLPVTDSHKMIVGMLTLGDISHKVGKSLSGELLRAVSDHHV
jgi:CBS domain-containing protein